MIAGGTGFPGAYLTRHLVREKEQMLSPPGIEMRMVEKSLELFAKKVMPHFQ